MLNDCSAVHELYTYLVMHEGYSVKIAKPLKISQFSECLLMLLAVVSTDYYKFQVVSVVLF